MAYSPKVESLFDTEETKVPPLSVQGIGERIWKTEKEGKYQRPLLFSLPNPTFLMTWCRERQRNLQLEM